MKILVLDKEKITKLTLPNEIDGAFFIQYKTIQTKLDRTLNIEANNNRWMLKSDGRFNIKNGDTIVPSIILQEYTYTLLEMSSKEIAYVYCSPTYEKNNPKLNTMNATELVIGKAQNCDIRYNNPGILDFAIKIQKSNNYWQLIATPDENNLVYVNDQRTFNTILKAGDIIFLNGLQIIWMNNFFQINNPQNQVVINAFKLPNYIEAKQNINDYEKTTDEEENIELYSQNDYFFHTPNMREFIKKEEIVIDPPPSQQKYEEVPFYITMGSSLTMFASAFMSGYSVFYTMTTGDRPIAQMVPQIVMCVSLVIGSLIMPRVMSGYQKRKHKKLEKLRQTKYKAYIDEKQNEINIIMKKQTSILMNENKDLEQCCINIINNKNYWTREIKDQDFLTVRLGLGDTDTNLEIKAPEKKFTLEEDNLEEEIFKIVNSSHKLTNVPITYSFLDHKISAIISREYPDEKDYINCLILQLIHYYSAVDLKLVFLINDNDNRWNYLKYIPHAFSENKVFRYFAKNLEEMKQVSSKLEEEYNKRLEQQGSENSKEDKDKTAYNTNEIYKNFDNYYLVITNDYLAVKDLPIVNKILESNINYGFSFLIIENSLKRLPNECDNFIMLNKNDACVIEKNLNQENKFTPEVIKNLDMRTLAYHLLNIPIMEETAESILPKSLPFLDIFDVSKIEQLNILNRWKTNDPTTSLAAPIGVHVNGEKFNLDLHEKFHGPHGLIAGSTGSGKSEFIITYVLSMILNYRPEEVQFVLIDYKGGGLAGAFENKENGTILPHIAGTITNLDESEMNRSLVSINSELKRRQKKFNDVRTITGESTIDIYKYQKYYREGVITEPISHLFIVCDEFAELKSQQPDFMDELISTARIGRSLGVHLVLATQKPTGVVNEQIWSNSKFKICLKVQNRSDSMEMLKKPDAASIKETGRFYLQVGYDEYFDIGQSGWSGAKYVPSDKIIKKVDDSINFINNTGNIIKTVNNLLQETDDKKHGDQLTNILKTIIKISEKDNLKQRRLWLEPLPKDIYLSEIRKKYNYTPTPYLINPIIGEYDNPEKQIQNKLELNLTENGNTLIYGKSGSGKENLLSTIIYSSIMDHKPDELNYYIIDLGAEILKIYRKLPHVGDMCFLNDAEKILQLMILLDKEIDRRKELFVDYGGNYKEYCATSGQKEPLIVTIINNYEVFSESFPKYADMITSLYRDGQKYGIIFIITTSATNTVRSRVAELFGNKLCLQMANESDYRTLLDSPRKLKPANYKGRGIIKTKDGCYEFQSASIYLAEKTNALIKDSVEKLSAVYKTKPKKIPVLPDFVTYDLVSESVKDLTYIPIGYNVSTKEEYGYDFSKDKVSLILSNQINSKSSFINSLVKLVYNVKDLNIKIFDLNDLIETKNAYKDQFDINIINLEKILNEKEKKNLIIFVGIGTLKEKISQNKNAITSYNNIFNNLDKYENTNFIFIDDAENYKKVQLEPWGSKINNKNGIWLGEGVSVQIAIKFTDLSFDDRNLTGSDLAFVSNNTKKTIIKNVILEEENEE